VGYTQINSIPTPLLTWGSEPVPSDLIELEDGSGCIELEDGSGCIELEI
jgi:hypothetical protein